MGVWIWSGLPLWVPGQALRLLWLLVCRHAWPLLLLLLLEIADAVRKLWRTGLGLLMCVPEDRRILCLLIAQWALQLLATLLLCMLRLLCMLHKRRLLCRGLLS